MAEQLNPAVQRPQPIQLQGHLFELRRDRREFREPAVYLAQTQFHIQISVSAQRPNSSMKINNKTPLKRRQSARLSHRLNFSGS
jgi:hypothetical protein